MAVLGAGRIGSFRARVLSGLPEVEGIIVGNRTVERAEKLAEEIGGRAGTIEEAVDSKPDAIFVSLATELHVEALQGHPVEGDWLERFRTAYVIEMQQWVADVHNGQLAGSDAWDGYISLVAVESCIASLKSGSPQRSPTSERPALYEELAEVENERRARTAGAPISWGSSRSLTGAIR